MKRLYTTIIVDGVEEKEAEDTLSQLGARGWQFVSGWRIGPTSTRILMLFELACPMEYEDGFNSWARERRIHHA